LAADGLSVPSGLALSLDGDTLYATGTTDRREPALFTLPPAGGTALVRYRGAPLASPSGVHVDEAGVAWVMDYVGGSGESGALFAIAPDGAISTVLEGLRLGAPAGVTLTAGGGTAVIPTRDANGAGQLTSVRIDNGQRQELAAPILADPTGIRAAREANVMVVVDSEGDAIFRAE
jgi:sugar lactone lactonase YvrE